MHLIKGKSVDSIANRYYQNVYEFCCARLENADDARDVTQEVFLLFAEKADKLEEDKILAWLLTVANNKIKEAHRESTKKSRFVSYDDSFRAHLNDPNFSYEIDGEVDDYLFGDEVESKREWIKSKLSPEENLLFEYLCEHRLNRSEIAKELNIEKTALNARVHRLRKKVIQLLQIYSMFIIFAAVKLGISNIF